MVKLPDGFVATKYPGYFWNIPEQQLYSIKVGGILKPLKITKAENRNKFIRYTNYKLWDCDGYAVSVNGQRRVLFVDYLEKLTENDSVIPVRNKM